MKPMKKPPMVKRAPMIVKMRTRMAPVLTRDAISLFIIRDPIIMTTPQTAPIPPQMANAVLRVETPATDDKEDGAIEEEAATIKPAIR